MSRFAGAMLALGLCLLAPWAGLRAQLGTQPIKILYGFVAGSGGDLLSRIVADRMQGEIGQSVIVDNRPGASGKIALVAVKAAVPDGSTLYIGPNGPMTIIPLHDSRAGYDPQADFAPITQLVTFDFALVVAPNVPAKTLKELLAYLKAHPDKGAFGTAGPGTSMHFLGLKLGAAAGLDFRAVHYRGSALAITDVMAGQTPMAILPLVDVIEPHRSGQVRIVATSNSKRSIFLPDVPTFKEQGFDVRSSGWYAAYAPAKTPPEIIARLNKIMVETVQTPEIRDRLFAMGFQATGTQPEAVADDIREETEYWRPIVAASGFKSED